MLYVNPVTKVIQLTILPRHVAYDGVPTKVFEDLNKGDIMEAKVTRTEKKGVHLSLPQGVTAFAAVCSFPLFICDVTRDNLQFHQSLS